MYHCDTAVVLPCFPKQWQQGTLESKKALCFPSFNFSFIFFFSWKLTGMAWIPQECGSLAFLSPCTVQYWWQIGVIKEQKQWPEQSRDCLGLAFHKQKLTTFQQWSKYVSYIYQKKKKRFSFLQRYLVMCLSMKILIQNFKYSPHRMQIIKTKLQGKTNKQTNASSIQNFLKD